MVVLSPHSEKYWPLAELDALFNQEAQDRGTRPPRILPVRCDLTHAELTARDPLLAGRRSVGWDAGIDEVARQIAAAVRSVRTAPGGRSPLYGVPRRRALEFVGRDADLDRLDTLLVPGGRVGVAASIEGLAGVGKTELALQMVDRLAQTDRFRGGIFWLEAASPDLMPGWGAAIADALAVPSGPTAERASSSLRIVSNGGPALVVLDNVESWTHEAAPHPLPTGPHVAVLVTSRHHRLGGTGFKHLGIECLAADAARALLITVAGRDLAISPGLDDLLAHLAGHTLALELAGAYLGEFPDVTPAVYLARLQSGVPVEEKSRSQIRYERTVEQAFDATWAHLDAGSRRALCIAGCFADEDATIALLAACGVDDDARHVLRRFHLIRESGERWSMHRLVRAYTRRAGAEGDRRAAQRAFVEGCLAHTWKIDGAAGVRIYRPDRAHLEHAIELGEVLDDVARLGILRDRVGVGAHSSGELVRARDLLERALASHRQHAGEEHPAVSVAKSNLALVLKDLG